MFGPCQSSRRNSSSQLQAERHGDRAAFIAAKNLNDARRGLAITELLMIVMIPCFCLFGWAMIDKDFTASLLAKPTTDAEESVNPVYAIVPTTDGIFATLHSTGQVRFYDTTNSTILGDIQSHLVEVRCGAYSAPGNLLAVGSAMGNLEVWDLDQPEKPLAAKNLREHDICLCKFTPDGSQLISVDDIGQLMFWNPRSLELQAAVRNSKDEDSVRTLAISHDGKRLLAGTCRGRVHVWDLEKRSLAKAFQLTSARFCPTACIEALAWLPGDREFVAASRTEGIAIWNTTTGECMRTFPQSALPKVIRSGELSADGRVIVCGTEQGEIQSWDISTGSQIGSTKPSNSLIRALGCNHDGRVVLCGDWTGHVNWQRR